jgi:hypothetical protein
LGRAAEIKALVEVLEDETNLDISSQEISEKLLDSLDAVRGRTHRIAVVGQISHEMPGGGLSEPQTVVLGPFSSRGILDSPEKFRRALETSSARSDGQQLAWDSKTGTGRGRFMLVPAFHRPRDAWDFYRPDKVGDPFAAEITESIARWQPGLWTEEHDLGPVCHCAATRPGRVARTSAGDLVKPGPCPIHPGGGVRDQEEE